MEVNTLWTHKHFECVVVRVVHIKPLTPVCDALVTFVTPDDTVRGCLSYASFLEHYTYNDQRDGQSKFVFENTESTENPYDHMTQPGFSFEKPEHQEHTFLCSFQRKSRTSDDIHRMPLVIKGAAPPSMAALEDFLLNLYCNNYQPPLIAVTIIGLTPIDPIVSNLFPNTKPLRVTLDKDGVLVSY